MQAISKEAFAAEDALQRQLAKKLGIKGKKRKVGAPAEKPGAEELAAMRAGMQSTIVTRTTPFHRRPRLSAEATISLSMHAGKGALHLTIDLLLLQGMMLEPVKGALKQRTPAARAMMMGC